MITTTRTPILSCLLVACVAPELDALPGARVAQDYDAASEGDASFYRAPWPSDLRLVDGSPALDGLPGVDVSPVIEAMAQATRDEQGFSVLPVAWMAFPEALPARSLDEPLDASASAPIQLIDIDPDSPERGRRIPVVAQTLGVDRYVPEPNLLAMAPVSGFVLRAGTTYAFVVRRDLTEPALGVGVGVREALHGVGEGPVAELARPLAALLPEVGLDADELAAFTVFTTGDVVGALHDLTETVRDRHTATFEGLSLHAADDLRPGYCELRGSLVVPQLQFGEPPWSSDGLIRLGDDGVPEVFRDEAIPVVITVPAAPMPEGGFPLAMYFHGSGGRADQVVSRGPVTEPGGSIPYGYGPAWVLAEYGFAAAGSAHPISPDRVPGASAFGYLNPSNLVVFRDIFRQGVVEQRLYLDALLDLEIDRDLLDGCAGVSLPAGAAAYRFDADAVVGMGQSMGAMYANLVGAVEPRIGAVVPTGAGGHWSRMGLSTGLLGTGGAAGLVQALLQTDQELTFVHPAMHVAQTAWAAAEPFAYLPRLGQTPLDGHPARSVYQPVGFGDRYFEPEIFDSMALGYGNGQAGEEVWDSMQDLLARGDLEGLYDYAITANRDSDDGRPWTGVVVQYEGDGLSDPHNIFVQLEEVRTQYGCFVKSFAETGEAVVVEGTVGCD